MEMLTRMINKMKKLILNFMLKDVIQFFKSLSESTGNFSGLELIHIPESGNTVYYQKNYSEKPHYNLAAK